MTFPVEFHIAGRAVPAHAVFETLAYVVGFQTYLLLRRREVRASEKTGRNLPLSPEATMWVIVAAVFGALFGSKLLAWLESAREYWAHRDNLAALLGGKTIVGGLLGGWIGVELAKRKMRITRRTGDAFVIPLCLGIAIGRIGCFLTGLPDHTYGTHSSLPWAVDFGDGPRHPTQLYESIFAIVLMIALIAPSPWQGEGWGEGRSVRWPEGSRFRLFMLGYLTFRFLVEFIKPSPKPLLGISAIQLSCAIAAIVCVVQFATRRGLQLAGLPVQRSTQDERRP